MGFGPGCGDGGFYGGNSTILFFILVFLILFNGFGWFDGGFDC